MRELQGLSVLTDTYIAGIFVKGNGTIKRDRNRTASHRYEAKGSFETECV